MSDRAIVTIQSARVAVISGYPAVHAGLTVLLERDPAIEIVPLELGDPLGMLTIDAIVVDHAGLETAVELSRDLAVRPPFVVLGA